jgi:hypothetical protein
MQHLFLDIHCAPCHQAAGGDPDQLRSAPRRARFWRDASGGPVGAEPFSDKRPWRKPYGLGPQPHRRFPASHQRPDGGCTWDLSCPKGHTKPIQHEHIVAAFHRTPEAPGPFSPGASRLFGQPASASHSR